MGAEDGCRDPITEELDCARRTSGRFWALQWLRIPDYAELAGGWAGLPRSGGWVVLVFIIGLIMVVPLVGMRWRCWVRAGRMLLAGLVEG